MKFIITVLTYVSLTDFFVWWYTGRILRKTKAALPYKVAFHAFMLFQVLAQFFIIVGRVKGWDVDQLMPMPLMIATFIWHLILAPIALVLNLVVLTWEVANAAYRLYRRKFPKAAVPATSAAAAVEVPTSSHAVDPGEATTVPAAPLDPDHLAPPTIPVSRRQFLTAAVALTPPLVTIISSTIASQQIQNFRIRRIVVPSPQLPKELDGITIAHVSDTHVGRFSNGKVLHRIAEATNELKADIVAVTGDIINDSLRWMPEAVDMLNRIDSEVYLCEGNHDLIDNGMEFRTQIKALPDRFLLLNETRTALVRNIPVQMMGLSWNGPNRTSEKQFRGEFSLSRSTEHLLRQSDPDLYRIMLAHHPHAWDHTPDVPLTLAGHTHGGQIMLNEELGFGPVMFRYWTGLYTREQSEQSPNGSALVVSNGAGNWFPLRIAAPAEIVHITLRRV